MCVYPFVPNPTTVLTCVDSTTWIVMEINISQPHHLYDGLPYRTVTDDENFSFITKKQARKKWPSPSLSAGQ